MHNTTSPPRSHARTTNGVRRFNTLYIGTLTLLSDDSANRTLMEYRAVTGQMVRAVFTFNSGSAIQPNCSRTRHQERKGEPPHTTTRYMHTPRHDASACCDATGAHGRAYPLGAL